jgi:hypothetical protein
MGKLLLSIVHRNPSRSYADFRLPRNYQLDNEKVDFLELNVTIEQFLGKFTWLVVHLETIL